MGTSKGYGAPTTPEWSAFKAEVTRLARDGRPTPETARQVLSDYIATNGGARKMAHGSGTIGGGRAAQGVARNLANFISTVGSLGLQETLRQRGLDFLIGQPASEIVFSLLDHLGGSSSTIDEVDARNALLRLMDELLGDVDSADVERILQEQAQGEAFQDLLLRFFGYYLYEQFCRVYYERLVARVGDAQADAFHDGILEYIKWALRHATLGQDISRIDWVGEQGKAIADEILQDTLEIFGH